MIFYDIKSLTWYPTISWTVCETRIFLQTLEAKITTEIQRNVKLLHLLNEKVICLTVREAPKLEAATLAGACVNFTDSAETFLVSKWSRIFQISFLTWTSKIQKIKLQTKELTKMADMADEELEKSIDDQKSVNTCRSTTPDWSQ